jgi:aryl-alcohol dehydrogenase-like predicted oxidoreductase
MQGNREGLFFSLKVGAPTPAQMVEKIDKHLKHLRRDAIDILRVHQFAYAARPELVEKVSELRQAGKVRSLCLIRHTPEEQEAYAARGPDHDGDADLVIYNYVARGQEPGIEQSGSAGKGVLIMKALGGGTLGWKDKVLTDWTRASEETVSELAVGEISSEFRKVVYNCCFGPWRELAAPGCEIPKTNAAVRWILRNKHVSSVLVAVANLEELEEALGVA